MAKITFETTGQTFEVAEGTSYMEFCQANDAPQDFGCTVGSCGTCVFVPVSGGDALDPMDDEERETVEMTTADPGARLGCGCTVRGDMTVRPANT